MYSMPVRADPHVRRPGADRIIGGTATTDVGGPDGFTSTASRSVLFGTSWGPTLSASLKDGIDLMDLSGSGLQFSDLTSRTRSAAEAWNRITSSAARSSCSSIPPNHGGRFLLKLRSRRLRCVALLVREWTISSSLGARCQIRTEEKSLRSVANSDL